MVGFGLYGSIHGPSEYDVTIQLIHTVSGRLLGSNEILFSKSKESKLFNLNAVLVEGPSSDQGSTLKVAELQLENLFTFTRS